MLVKCVRIVFVAVRGGFCFLLLWLDWRFVAIRWFGVIHLA